MNRGRQRVKNQWSVQYTDAGSKGWKHTRGADKSLARPGRKQARKHVRDERDFNNIETRAVSNFFPLQGKAPKEIHAILTETFACLLPGRAKYLSAPLYFHVGTVTRPCCFELTNSHHSKTSVERLATF